MQSTTGVRSVTPVEPGLLEEMLQHLAKDLPPSGIKLGMLATAGNVSAAAGFLQRFHGRAADRVPVVLDPVIRASSGAPLLTPDGLSLLRAILLPLVDWITPNRAELGMLCDCDVQTAARAEAAALKLARAYPGLGVIVTGGDLAAPDDLVVEPNGVASWLRGRKIESSATHGTGCAFSSSLLCHLLAGRQGVEAARMAKHFVEQAIRLASPIGSGRGPMNLLWPLRSA